MEEEKHRKAVIIISLFEELNEAFEKVCNP